MSNNGMIGLITVTDEMAAKGLAGASVSWRLPTEADFDEVCAALKRDGFEFLPEPTSPAAALLRVMTQRFQSKNTLVKSVPNPNETKLPAYGVLPKHEDGRKLTFAQSWACGLDKDANGGPALYFSESCPMADREDVEVLFPSALSNLGSTELSGWLVNLIRGIFRGVPTVGGAGTYFIGPEEVPRWRKLRTCLHPFGVRLYEIPAMRSEQAMECVLESVRRYTEDAVTELQDDLDKYKAVRSDPDPKKRSIQTRALQSRLDKVTEQCAVVEKYEKLFDTKLDELRTSLAGLQSGFILLANGG